MSTTTTTAKKSSEKPAGGKLRRVTIEPAENGGAVVTCDRERPERDNKKSMMCEPWNPPKPAAFTEMDEAIEYAAKELGCDIKIDDGDEKEEK